MPRLVQWSRFSDAFQRLFGIQGSTQLNVIDDVFLTLPVEREDAHQDFLRGWKPFAGFVVGGASAGNKRSCRIGATPNRLVVIDGLLVYSTVNGAANIGLLPALGGAAITTLRDPRAIAPGVTTAVAANAASVFATNVYALPAGISTPTPVNVPWVVTDQQDLVIEHAGVNADLQVSFWGASRELTPQER